MNENLAGREAPARGLGSVLVAAMLLGTVGVTTRTLYQISAANPLSVGFFRMAIGAPVLAALCWRTLRERAWLIERRDLLLMLLLGASLGLSQVCYFSAIASSGVTIATLITLCTSPILVTILATGLMHERVTPLTIGALGCALAGTALLAGLQPGKAVTGADATGAAFALGAAVFYAIFTVCSRHLAQRYHPLQTTTVGFAVGSVLLLGMASASGFVTSYPAEGWLLLIYLGTVASALAYGLYLAGIRSVTATLASISSLVELLTAAVLAWLLFGEKLAPLGLLGAGLLLGAIVVMYRAQRQPDPAGSTPG